MVVFDRPICGGLWLPAAAGIPPPVGPLAPWGARDPGADARAGSSVLDIQALSRRYRVRFL
jgi:hypothetical protein